MGKIRLLFLFALSLFLLSSCDAIASVENRGKKESSSICVASWNVQNLFDTVLDGTEYDEYKPSEGWTDDAYKKRLSNARRVLGYLPEAGERIIILNEIENPKVVEDLINSKNIANLGLHWYVCAGTEGGAIRTAVISSIPIAAAHVHEVGDNLRPVLEVCFDTSCCKIFVLAVHLKSNVGGVSETSGARRKAADVAVRIAHSLESEFPGCLVLICGDMNEECWDDGIMGRSEASDSPLKVSDSFQRGFWHCFWLETGKEFFPGGSYFYNGSWKSYDNILISASGQDSFGWEYCGCGVIFKGILKTADEKPNAWNRSLLTGVSDHLPVWIKLRKAD